MQLSRANSQADEAPAPRAARTNSLPLNKFPRRVLVIDDEPLLLWSIAEMLRSQGIEVIEASSAKEALRAITTDDEAPDVVLSDLNLPDNKDLGLLKALRIMAPAARIVLMTAFGTSDIREEARQLGVDVIDKPFDLVTLKDVIAGTVH